MPQISFIGHGTAIRLTVVTPAASVNGRNQKQASTRDFVIYSLGAYVSY